MHNSTSDLSATFAVQTINWVHYWLLLQISIKQALHFYLASTAFVMAYKGFSREISSDGLNLSVTRHIKMQCFQHKRPCDNCVTTPANNNDIFKILRVNPHQLIKRLKNWSIKNKLTKWLNDAMWLKFNAKSAEPIKSSQTSQ